MSIFNIINIPERYSFIFIQSCTWNNVRILHTLGYWEAYLSCERKLRLPVSDRTCMSRSKKSLPCCGVLSCYVGLGARRRGVCTSEVLDLPPHLSHTGRTPWSTWHRCSVYLNRLVLPSTLRAHLNSIIRFFSPIRKDDERTWISSMQSTTNRRSSSIRFALSHLGTETDALHWYYNDVDNYHEYPNLDTPAILNYTFRMSQ